MQQLLKRLNEWLSHKPYTKAAYITAVATIVMAVTSAIMSYTIVQNNRALNLTTASLAQADKAMDLTRKSFELQRSESKLRNRPIVDLDIEATGFRGAKIHSDGTRYDNSVAIALVNSSDIPAVRIQSTSRVLLNGQITVVDTITNDFGSLSKNGRATAALAIPKDIYDSIMNTTNRILIPTEVTYSGLLDQETKPYRTSFVIRYNVTPNAFSYADKEFK